MFDQTRHIYMSKNPKPKICRDCGFRPVRSTTAKLCSKCGGFLRVFR